ncbi:MAG: ATP-binding protein [Syntrophomonas sp.]|nr:ATP-binding protein [Syntrophomonas sp.]
MSNMMYHSEENLIKLHITQALSAVDIENNHIVFVEPKELIRSGTYIYIFDVKNRLINGPDANPEIIDTVPLYDKPRYVSVSGSKWLILDQPLQNDNKTIAWIRASRPLEPVSEALHSLIMISLFAFPIYLLIAIAGGLFISGRALSPIDKITKTAREIGQGNLAQRLNLPKVEDEVGRLALTFDEMLDRLESAFKRERQFTSDASHELRTPITVISAHAEESLIGQKSTQEYKESLNVILKESRMMGQIVSQLLMLTRSDEGKYKLEIEDIYLNIIVNDVMQEMQKNANDAGVELKLTVNESIKIKADQMLITRAIINLIDNAIKYNKTGGWVKISLYTNEGFARLIVEDNGIGMINDEIPNIFKRFYRIDKARSVKGTGIGLSLVQWIVNAHKGIIRVESVFNHGTKFEIDLPIE